MKKKSTNILIIISIISCIILLIGAIFSYFTINNRSNEDAIKVNAAKTKLDLKLSSLYVGDKLLPMNDSDVMKAYNNECLDDFGNRACLAYTIEVTSYYPQNEIIGNISFNVNDIENLSYLVLDDNNNIYLDKTSIDKNNSSNLSLGNSFTIENANSEGKTKKFILIIWLTNLDVDQSITDARKNFNASVSYNSIYGSNLTASLS